MMMQDFSHIQIPDDIVAIELISVSELKSTEKINLGRARSLASKVQIEKVWSNPILVDRDSKIVMDGNHRLWVAQHLNLRVVPCLAISYNNRHLSLTRWAGEEAIRPEDVISAGLSGNLLDFKTTRHILATEIDLPIYDLTMLR